jgi:actin-related protein
MTAFACGRPTALVVEIGAREASAIAIHDGALRSRSRARTELDAWLTD